MVVRTLAWWVAAGSLLVACGSGSQSSSGSDAGGPCDHFSDWYETVSEVDGDDIDSVRGGLARTRALLADEIARSTSGEVRSAAIDVREWAASVSVNVEGDFELSPGDTWAVDSRESAAAKEVLGEWANTNRADLYANVRPDVHLILCLGVDTTQAEWDQVNSRLEVPTGREGEFDQPDGVVGVSWSYGNGHIEITLDRFLTPERRAELESILGAAPVDRVTTVDVPFDGQRHSGGLTPEC